MKLITAVIRPAALAHVRQALRVFGVAGLTVTQIAAATWWDRHIEVYRSEILVADTAPRLRLEVLVHDEDAHDLLRVIARAAELGPADEERAWISPVDTVARVRTGERDDDAL
jgi:nitrogen regulatory protein P-II 1